MLAVRRFAPLLRYLAFVFVIPPLVLGVTRGLGPGRGVPEPPAPEILRQRQRAGLPLNQAYIDELMHPWLAERIDDVAAHRAYVDISMDVRDPIPRRRAGGAGDPLWDYYGALREGESGYRRDVATYALGLAEVKRDSLGLGLAYYDAVEDRRLPFLHLSRGAALEHLHRPAAADSEYRVEIALRHAVGPAVANLGLLRLSGRRWTELAALRGDTLTAPWLPDRVRRALDLHEGRVLPYLAGWLRALALPFKPALLLLALYTSLVWFLLVRWWDAFEKEPLSLSLLTVGLGVLTPAGVYLFHDILSQFAHVELSGSYGHDLGYFIVIVGLLEESVKILPVFLVARFRAAEIDEPIDWLVYGCLAALGFSLLENYQYLVVEGLRVGAGRYFLSTPFHLSLTGTLALAVPGALRGGRFAWPRFALVLLGVAAVHGTFDFLLTRESALGKGLGFLLGPLWGVYFLKTLGGVASSSPYRTRPEPFRTSCTSWFMGAYVLFCLLKYLAITLGVAPPDAAQNLVGDLIGGQVFFLIALVYTKVSFNRDPRVPPRPPPPPAAPTPPSVPQVA